ncbi:MAG: insulinase family protein [Alphaproteobacteria bacterium]|jgi:predicted Zn-dependent peptidase|nr:insulinase family protein [Alphaproteobacteria bacterium]
MNPAMTRLDSGLRVVTDRVDAVESASVGVWIGAGSRFENAEINGVAHLLEHMAFKGTERRSAQAIAEEMDAVGGHLNAFTARETTAFYAKVLKEDVPLAVDLLADILLNARLDEDELARERSVVLQEIGQVLDTPDDIIFDHFQSTAFPDQPLGWPVLGTAEIVGRLSRRDLAGYMARHYGANSMVLVAAGNVEHEAVVALAERGFAGLGAGAESVPPAGLYRGGDYREARALEQLNLMLGFPGVGVHDPDHYAQSVLAMALGGGMSSRLFQEIRERRGLVYAINAFASPFTDGGLIAVYAATGEAETAELVSVLCDEVQRLGEDLRDEEVDRARAQLKASLLMGLESTSTRCDHIGHHVLLYGRPTPPETIIRRLDTVDAAAVRGLAGRLFRERPTLAAIGPIGQLPDFETVAARFR